MLVGTYEHSMDDKSRLVLPRAFLDHFGTGGYVTKGVDRCLTLLTQQVFDEESQTRFEAAKSGTAAQRNAARVFNASAQNFTLDKARRIVIPPGLREYAGLDHSCVVIGSYDRVEVWDADAWAEISTTGDLNLAEPEAAS
ncbi:MAG: division/cell wall cluster transcriptional repressor MraZ [Acidimicrobiales bacterium]